ncbi:hypothetical protein [Halalkalibacillus sediminis]|uniref:hypothetical protein n=1 Tax=Halalkalibacillus sediminis TaxID=2018042 RepID=UPI001EE4ACF9|nr:hypothetical protein [Halalkalibacillus sediminis]
MNNLDDLFTDLEEYRTPQEMKLYFEKKKQIINNNEKYISIARLKTGKVKKFIEEFYPLYLFSQSRFVDNYAKCKIILGNQGYDASIVQKDDTESFIELTSYIDGKWEYQDAKRLNSRGYGDIRFGDYKNLNARGNDYLKDVLKNIKKKSLKDYSGISLLFAVDTFDYFEVYDHSSKPFIKELIKEIKSFKFKADKMYLMVINNQNASQIDQNIYPIS